MYCVLHSLRDMDEFGVWDGSRTIMWELKKGGMCACVVVVGSG